MANLKKNEIKNLTFSLCGGNTNLPLSIRLQEYPGMSDLWHSHEDFAELVIITNGKVINEMSEHSVFMQTGDIMVMYPGSIHRYDRIRHLRHYNVLFAPKLLDGLVGLQGNLNFSHLLGGGDRCNISEILHLDEKELFGALELLENMRQEKINFSPGHEGAMLANFYLLLIHIIRHAKLRTEAANPAAFRISQTIMYMERKYDQTLNLQELCSHAHMSESSFRHHFRNLTELSPIDYLIKLRLRRAALMMFHSDQPITNIAFSCGFSDSNYFARKFRQVFQYSPREFRSRCASGELDIFQEVKKLQLLDI